MHLVKSSVIMIAIFASSLIAFVDTGNGSEADLVPSRADPLIDGTIGPSEYESSKNFDEGKFELFWTTTGGDIFIGMRAEVTGWLSLGLDPVDVMTNSDMIFGGVSGGTIYIYDALCTNDVGNHPQDTTFPGGTFDTDDYDATESSGTTTVEFRRKMSTGDPYDKKFVNGTTMKIMWATHKDSDDWTDEHDDAEYSTMTFDGTPPPPPPVSTEFDGVVSDGEYANTTSFDGGNFQLYWRVNGTDITLGMKVLTTGWISLGISPSGSMMLGADFLMGGFDGTRAYAEDHFATTTTAHVLDTDLTGGTDDIDSYNATESGGWTHFEMRRALVTGDPNDKDIIIGTMSVIWGFSTSDNLATKHTKVGYGTWRVDAAPPPPPPPPPKADFDGIISEGEYGNITKVDSDRFELHWKVNGTSIDVGVRAQTTGYVSIGIDPTLQMKDADMIFGWVDSGSAHSEDHWGTGFTSHMKDEDLGGTFDIISYNGTESGGWTTFEFRRDLSTPDAYDRAIRTDVAFPLIWAVANTDDPTATHSRRGTIMWNLSNDTPPPPPPPLPHISELDGTITDGEYNGTKTFDSDRIELHWNVSGSEIYIGIKAQATGWISLGIDPENMMEGADYLIGGFDGEDPYAEDHYGNSGTTHLKDTLLGGMDDILDYNSTENGGWTTLELKRNLSASDPYDKQVRTDGAMIVIWAYSDSDDPTAKHTRTISGTWNLNTSVTPPPPPPPPPKNTTLDGAVSPGEYDDSASFGGGSFTIHWSVNGTRVWMAMVARTAGWVSIGFEPSSAMKDADMVFGWVENGMARIEDHWGTGMTTHSRDEELGGSFDIPSFNGTESGGNTTIEFIRDLDTGDAYDKAIPSEGSVNIIWAYGSLDDPTSAHSQRGAGTLLIYMDQPEPTERLDGVVTSGEYRDSATFDFDNFRAYWTIEGQDLHMAISAKTVGWVSIGFDPVDIMKDSDVVLGWVENGVVHIIDAYSTGQYGPHPPDTHLGGTTDIIEYNGTEEDGVTTIEFVRKLSTGDEYDKVVPTSGNMRIMWAYGEHDDFGETHSKRGFAMLTMGPGGNVGLHRDRLFHRHGGFRYDPRMGGIGRDGPCGGCLLNRTHRASSGRYGPGRNERYNLLRREGDQRDHHHRVRQETGHGRYQGQPDPKEWHGQDNLGGRGVGLVQRHAYQGRLRDDRYRLWGDHQRGVGPPLALTCDLHDHWSGRDGHRMAGPVPEEMEGLHEVPYLCHDGIRRFRRDRADNGIHHGRGGNGGPPEGPAFLAGTCRPHRILQRAWAWSLFQIHKGDEAQEAHDQGPQVGREDRSGGLHTGGGNGILPGHDRQRRRTHDPFHRRHGALGTSPCGDLCVPDREGDKEAGPEETGARSGQARSGRGTYRSSGSRA